MSMHCVAQGFPDLLQVAAKGSKTLPRLRIAGGKPIFQDAHSLTKCQAHTGFKDLAKQTRMQ